MTDYNQYVTAINKIFDNLAKMKAGWNNQDNHNYIESIEEYKQVVANDANKFKTSMAVKKEETPEAEPIESLEALGND